MSRSVGLTCRCFSNRKAILLLANDSFSDGESCIDSKLEILYSSFGLSALMLAMAV